MKSNSLTWWALTVDLPEYNLSKGQVGTVVELLKNGAAYEVEFSDRNGRTYQSLGLRPDHLSFRITSLSRICESQCQFGNALSHDRVHRLLILHPGDSNQKLLDI